MFHLFVIDQCERTPAGYFKGSVTTLEEAYQIASGDYAEVFKTDGAGVMSFYAKTEDNDEFLDGGTTRVKRVRGWKFADGTFQIVESYNERWVPTPTPTASNGLTVTGYFPYGHWERE